MFGKCELCGRETMLERHHVWGGASRKKSEKLGAVAYLCPMCHREGKKAVHKCRETADALRAKTQARLMDELGWDTWRFIREFGKNYV